MADEQLLTRVVIRGEDRSQPAIRSARQGLRSVSDGLERLGTLAQRLLVIGAPAEGLRRGATAAVRAFSTIEDALIGVQKTTDLSATALARLDRRLADLSLDPSVALTRVELLGIAQAAGQLGVEGVEDLTRFSATIARLAAASPDLGLDEAATALARILKVTGEGVGSVDRLASSIARAGNTFAATEGEIARTSQRVAIATALYGVASKEAVALAAALRDLGIEAELGATAIGLGFQGIEAALRGGDGAQRLVELTGHSLAELRRQFETDAVGVFRAFVAGLADVSARGGDVVAILDEFGLSGARSVQVFGTLGRRVDVLDAALADMADEWERNTALTEESLRAAGTFSRQMQLVANEINHSAAAAGGALAPALLAVAQHWEALGLVIAGAAARGATATAQRIRAIATEVAAERRQTLALRTERIKRAAARRAEAAQAVAAAQHELAHAQHLQGAAALRRTAYQDRLARQQRVIDATGRLATAERNLAVSTSIATKAQRAHGLALRSTNLLLRGFRGAIGLLGGPIGAVTTLLSIGATAWAIWGNTAKRAIEDADAALDARIAALEESGRTPRESLDQLAELQRARIERLTAERKDIFEQIDDTLRVNRHFSSREALRVAYESGVTYGPPGLIGDLDAKVAEIAEAERQLEVIAAARRKLVEAGGTPGTGGDGAATGIALDAATAGLDELVAIKTRAEDRIAQLTLGRIALVDRAEEQAIAKARALAQAAIEEAKGDDTAIRAIEQQREEAITATREAAEEARTEIRREEAAEQSRLRADALARELAAEQAHLERRQRLVENAATARAAVEQQLQSGRDTLATPWERATAAIERWEATARQAVATARDAAVAAAEGGPDPALHAAQAAAEAERNLTRITELAAARRADAWEREAARRLRASRRWQDGATRALRDVQARTGDYAALAERSITHAFRGAGDAITEFVRTGKLQFGDLVDNILAGLARIALERALVGALGGVLDASALFQLRGAGGAGDSSVLLTSGTAPGTYHAGGIAGALGGVSRSGVPAAAFAAAPRLHGGGFASDEVPAILRRGEGVFTPEQMAALSPRAPEVVVNIENRGTAQQARPAQPRWDGTRWIVGVVLDDLSHNGPISQGIQSRFAVPDRTG